MSISLKQMRYFVAAAETGRIGQAAVELNVSQSAVTAAIQQLEAGLGLRLLDRAPAGVSVTLEGGRFLQQARDILAAVAEATRRSRVSPQEVGGSLRVGVTYTVAGYFLPRHLMRFAATFPRVEIDLFEAPRTVIEQALADGAIDMAVLLVSNLRSPQSIAFETLTRSRRRLWSAPGHALARLDRVGLADVAGQPYIMLTVDEAKPTTLRYWEAAGVAPNVLFRTSSVEAVRSMVAGGMGVTILSDMVYRPWSLDGQRIETRLLEEDIPTMDVGLAWAREAVLAPPAEAFRDFLRFALTGVGHQRPDDRAAPPSILSMTPAS